MFHRVLIVLSLLSWCCLAVPWTACRGHGHEGLQPVFYRCHAEHSCACEVHATSEAPAPEPGLPACDHGDHHHHQPVVFPQVVPDQDVRVPAPPDDTAGDCPELPPARAPVAPPVVVRARPGEPPGDLLPNRRQLRTDILLL